MFSVVELINIVQLFAQFIETLESTGSPETTVESLTKVLVRDVTLYV